MAYIIGIIFGKLDRETNKQIKKNIKAHKKIGVKRTIIIPPNDKWIDEQKQAEQQAEKNKLPH